MIKELYLFGGIALIYFKSAKLITSNENKSLKTMECHDWLSGAEIIKFTIKVMLFYVNRNSTLMMWLKFPKPVFCFPFNLFHHMMMNIRDNKNLKSNCSFTSFKPKINLNNYSCSTVSYFVTAFSFHVYFASKVHIFQPTEKLAWISKLLIL